MGIIDEKALDERIRTIARDEAARPALVTSRTAQAVVGVPRFRFVHDARARKFPSYMDRRLVIARTKDVLAYYEARISTAVEPSTNEADAEAAVMARVGARRIAVSEVLTDDVLEVAAKRARRLARRK